MMTDVIVFVQERFKLSATLPITFILFAGPASIGGLRLTGVILGWASTFLALLCLRMADDLVDLDKDRLDHPARGLPAGRINPSNLKVFMLLSLGALVLLNIASCALPVVVGTAIFYLLYFKGFKAKLPLIVRAPFSNVIFAVIPCYAGLLSQAFGRTQVFLGMFVWLAAVAHEWAHNVHGPGEEGLRLTGYATAVGPRQSAAVAVTLFAGAVFFACLAWLGMGQPQLFGILAMVTAVHVGLLGIRLIREPTYKNARPFYLAGFTFFLLPLAGLLVDGIFGQIALPT